MTTAVVEGLGEPRMDDHDHASPLPTGIVTFLLTDVAGSTRLWDGGSAGVADAIARHYAIVDEIVASHGGARPLEQGEGDSTVSAFARPSDALRAALAIQRAMAAERWPAGAEISVRIGVHTGEALLRDERNYYGEAITRCVRLRDLARGGQTLVSNATAALAGEDIPGGHLLDAGEHALPGLARPERVFQLQPEDVTLHADDLIGPARTAGVPAQVTSFVGRDRELHELADALRAHRLVTVVGTGGCGKTRLAIEVAAGFAEVCWIDLSPLSDPSLLRSAVATALGLRDTAATDAALIAHLRDRDLLLAVDNCEHLASECAALVDGLLRACERLRVLATSREALGIAGEHAWQVPSLSSDDAMSLFAERAAMVRPRFALTDENRAAVGTICERLDGIPLAIELAAARTRTLTPQQIADGLADRFRLLTGGSRTALARQRTLEASVEWSHALLRDEERVVLRRLSVFAGGFTLDAAERVCSGDGIDELAVLDLVTALVDRSLVHVDDDGRFRLLETIRDYARHKLSDAGEVAAARDRHLAFFLEMALRAEPELEGPRVFEVADALEADHDNLRAAIEWAIESSQADNAFRLVAALPLFWLLRDHVLESIDHVDEAVRLEGGDPALRARALLAGSLGGGRTTAGAARSRALLATGLDLARTIGDRRTEGRFLLWAGRDAQRTDRGATLPLLEAARRIAVEVGDRWCLAEADSHLGIASFISGDDLATARRAFASALETTASTGDPVCTGRTLLFSGTAEIWYGHLDVGIATIERAMTLLRGSGDRYGLTLGLAFLSRAYTFAGNYADARRLADAAIAGARGSAYVDRLGLALQSLAALEYAEGNLDASASLLSELYDNVSALGDQVGFIMTTVMRARVALATGMLDEASAMAQTCIDAAPSAVYRSGDIEGRIVLARVAMERGELTNAEAPLVDVLRTAAASDWPLELAQALDLLGELAARGERWTEATRVLAAADSARTTLGLPRYPVEQPAFDAAVGAARDALGDEAFETAWEEGARLTIDDVVEYVTRSRRERGRPSHGWESLTPTELQVVRLVREGLTNPQIAARLFNSPGTVRAHMSHIFAKVGVSTRAELAAEATRRDLQEDN